MDVFNKQDGTMKGNVAGASGAVVTGSFVRWRSSHRLCNLIDGHGPMQIRSGEGVAQSCVGRSSLIKASGARWWTYKT